MSGDRRLLRAVGALAFVAAGAQAQDSGMIMAPGRVDIAYDAAAHVLYISGGPTLRRYDLRAQQFLDPIYLGGSTWGLDISPDGRTLAVANRSRGASKLFVDLVNLRTLKGRRIGFGRNGANGGEGGTYAVAFDRDGKLLVTPSNDYGYSATAPLRRVDLTTAGSFSLGWVEAPSLLAPSADHARIAIAELNNTAAPFGEYTTGDPQYRSTWQFVRVIYDVALSASGDQLALGSYANAGLYQAGVLFGTVGSAPNGPKGVAYSPTKPSLYAALIDAPTIAEYDTATLMPLGSITVPVAFQGFGSNTLSSNGRIKVAADGTMLFATVGTGVFYAAVSPTR